MMNRSSLLLLFFLLSLSLKAHKEDETSWSHMDPRAKKIIWKIQNEGKGNKASQAELIELKKIQKNCADDSLTNLRNDIDLIYHGVYQKERQRFQNELIKETIKQVRSMKQKENPPVATFMIGPMGVGKGYIYRILTECGLILKPHVHSDPDQYKKQLPEFSIYANSKEPQKQERAGKITHRESSLLDEMVQREAIRLKKSLVIDGSLRDLQWNEILVKQLKESGYLVRVFQVKAKDKKIHKRVKRRGEETKRKITEDEMKDNIKTVRANIEIFKKNKRIDSFQWIENSKKKIGPILYTGEKRINLRELCPDVDF